MKFARHLDRYGYLSRNFLRGDGGINTGCTFGYRVLLIGHDIGIAKHYPADNIRQEPFAKSTGFDKVLATGKQVAGYDSKGEIR